jgi:hypothetical protein
VVNADDPGELIKAGAEGAASGAIGALIEPISGFLGKLFGGSAEQLGGWAADIVAFRRWKSRVRIAQKAEEFLLDAGLEAREVPRPVLMPMLEAMGDEEDESMMTRWASLLASAASREGSVPRSFPRILAELEPHEARILDHVYEAMSQIAPQFHPKLAVLTRAIASLLGLTDDQVTLGVDNLTRLRLVRAAGLIIGDAGDADGVRLTEFGWAFLRACRPPSEPDPPIRFNDPSVLQLAERNREMWTSPGPPGAGGEEAAQSVATATESNQRLQ